MYIHVYTCLYVCIYIYIYTCRYRLVIWIQLHGPCSFPECVHDFGSGHVTGDPMAGDGVFDLCLERQCCNDIAMGHGHIEGSGFQTKCLRYQSSSQKLSTIGYHNHDLLQVLLINPYIASIGSLQNMVLRVEGT